MLKSRYAIRLSKFLMAKKYGQSLYRFIKTRGLKKYYSDSADIRPKCERFVAFMSDDKMVQGGLCDRLWGAVTTYACCKQNGFAFRIDFKRPFVLEDFLVPNNYDWSVSKSDISENSRQAVPMFYPYFPSTFNEDDYGKNIAKLLNSRQVHVYTNVKLPESEFGRLFHELFRLSPKLEKLLGQELNRIGSEFFSVSFRFMNLLGDFVDIEDNHVGTEKRAEIIKKSLGVLNVLKNRHPQANKILVASDSVSFLREAEKIDFVYIVPGEVKHIGFVDNSDMFSIHAKTFLDLMMISKSQKSYLAWLDGMYKDSFFAKTGALIGNVPFEPINIDVTLKYLVNQNEA